MMINDADRVPPDTHRSRLHFRDGRGALVLRLPALRQIRGRPAAEFFHPAQDPAGGEDYKAALEPTPQVAQCVEGVMVLFGTAQKGLNGVQVNEKIQAVRCMGQMAPQQTR